MKTVEWTRIGPERPGSVEVPPTSTRLHGYILDYDAERRRVVYVCGPGFDGFGELWSFDGTAWTRDHGTTKRLDGEGSYAGYWDPSRGGIVVHQFAYDYESDHEDRVPQSLLITTGGVEVLKTEGEAPTADEDMDTFGPFGAFAYDPLRGVAVCLTPTGVFELDANGTWSKVATVDSEQVPTFWKNACGGCFDAVRGEVVLWLFDGDEYEHRFHAWDGESLRELSREGLPLGDMHVGLYEPSAIIGAHRTHGVVVHVGPEQGTYGRTDEGWQRIEGPSGGPPRAKAAQVCHDPERDLLVVGPGYYEDDDGGADAQRVFFVRRDDGWERMGVVAEASPLAALVYHRRYFVVGGVTYATRIAQLQTFAWTGETWEEVVDEATAKTLLVEDKLGAVVGGDNMGLAVTQKGATLRFDGKTWSRGPSIPDFGERTDFVLAALPGEPRRFVVWGGLVNNRLTNHTFVFDEGRWRKVKKASPRPSDFGLVKRTTIDFDAYWDSSLARVVRLGLSEVFTLEGDIWQTHTPRDYTELCGGRRSAHFPAHDPVSGVTLLINLETRSVVRFGLDRCERVGTLELPDELEPANPHDASVDARLRDDLWFDPDTRTLHAQLVEDKWARYGWALGGLFDAAAAQRPSAGPRLAPDPPTTKTGPKLSLDEIAALTAVSSRPLRVGKRRKGPIDDHAIDRIGGLPTGVTKREWPLAQDTPMGFLLQLDLRDVLERHAGIAVFCTLDGHATEEEDGTVALLLSQKQWSTAPVAKAPGDVPVLGVRPLTRGKARYEVIESKAQRLAEGDPEMGAAIDRLQASSKVHAEPPLSKVGGEPVFLQDDDPGDGLRFVGQLDFDDIALEGAWEEAGLCGCLYLFVSEDEREVHAMWQYT
jgi:hypothetical protein